MFRTFFHGANDYVEMTEEMDRGVLVTLGKRRRRRVVLAVAVVMALLVLLPWAASDPEAFQWLSRVAPPVAHFLRPDAGGQVENGIRLEAVEVTREDDTLLIHLTMEDLEGDRLQGRISPANWYYEQGRSRAYGSCVPYYDEQTGLLHLNFICDPEEDMQDFDWDRWVTVTICDLRVLTDTVEQIAGTWSIQVSVPQGA